MLDHLSLVLNVVEHLSNGALDGSSPFHRWNDSRSIDSLIHPTFFFYRYTMNLRNHSIWNGVTFVTAFSVNKSTPFNRWNGLVSNRGVSGIRLGGRTHDFDKSVG